jgi:beta-glucosidase
MPAYCDVDGLPCHISHELLSGILRGEWGFDGIVASDYVGLQMVSTQHRLSADLSVVAAAALRAGVDVELPSTVVFGDPLLAAIADGRIDEGALDCTVSRHLRMKFRLGLFENPYVDVPAPAALATLNEDESSVADMLAARSLVLVENDGILPLDTAGGQIAVIGPIADSARELLGDYAHLLHMETLRDMRERDNPLGFPLTDDPRRDHRAGGEWASSLRSRDRDQRGIGRGDRRRRPARTIQRRRDPRPRRTIRVDRRRHNGRVP